MRDEMRLLSNVCAGLLVFATTWIGNDTANSAPPSSCARKFIGVWKHEGLGQSNIANLTADGISACSGNAYCVQGTWTCNGNVLTYNNGMSSTEYTLQPNGTMTARGGIVVTRISPAPSSSKPPSGNSTQAETEKYKTEAAQFLNAAQAAEAVARKESNYNNWSIVEDRYRNAAESFGKAKDTLNQQRALANAERIKKIYSNLARKEQPSQTPKASEAGAPALARKAKCKAITDQIAKVKNAGEDAAELEQLRVYARCP